MPHTKSVIRTEPLLESPSKADFKFQGFLGKRIEANLHNWLLIAPNSNPAMLEIFRDRDRTPHRDLLPWSGEFAGKYLISAVQTLRITKDSSLKELLKQFVADLISTQRSDGYLGPFPSSEEMMGPGRWDLWGQYNVMLGLLDYFRETGDKTALASCRKCADHFCELFLNSNKRVVQAGSEEMNESSIHIFTKLYEETGDLRYLQMAREIEKDWEVPPSGDYIRTALAGKPYYLTPKPRWEGLHSIQAIAELYFITGEDKYRKAYEQIWWSIVEGDRHNTGGFSSGEQATGNPYDPRPIETCCTIAWTTITLDYLRMTGDSRAADELELSTWNAILGAQSPTGRWWTYNTPMDGDRKASAHDIVFQARPGSPELNCCSVNGPRGLGILSEWAVMTRKNGMALNWYGPSSFTVPLQNGHRIHLEQKTDFPRSGKILLKVTPASTEHFTLSLRIPGWSKNTTVRINGQLQQGVLPGSYLDLDREWQAGDEVVISLDMQPRFWAGEREAKGKASLYSGPVLLAYDPRFDTYDPGHIPTVDSLAVSNWKLLSENESRSVNPLLLFQISLSDNRKLTLCDFASAGAGGSPYVSWLPISGLTPIAFAKNNPLRALHH